MIYLDNGATTFPKPKSVKIAMQNALNTCGNPGRGGHIIGKNSEKIIYACRCKVAEMFNEKDEINVIFTMNATHALNIAIKSAMRDKGNAVISGYEHNSVVRPLECMENVTYTAVSSELFNEEEAYEKITKAVQEDTKCLVINHISNVFGNVMPIKRINDFCGKMNIKLILDISQSAGCQKIDLEELDSVSYLCMPGHKGLYGPSGTGILVCCKGEKPYSIIEGGTGSNSLDYTQPDFLPDMLESGTPNFIGIAGLCAGIEFVDRYGIEDIDEYKRELIDYFYNSISESKKFKIFYDKRQKSLISFTAYDKNDFVFSELTAKGFCLRNGLHCAPLAHKSANTIDYGTIRVSFSVFNTKNDVKALSREINLLINKI